MQDLVQIATGEIGVQEITGPQHNERILQYAREVGFGSWYTSDETPWCSLFLNWVAYRGGYERSNNGMASSWSTLGEAVTDPQPGDVVLLTSGPGSTRVTHVGLFVSFNDDRTRINVLGGNQSNTVNIAGFRTTQLVGYRRLRKTGAAVQGDSANEAQKSPAQPASPAGVEDTSLILRRGSRGSEVEALQLLLKQNGFDPGGIDADFGGKTETALMAFQRTLPGASATGVYDAATRAALEALSGPSTR